MNRNHHKSARRQTHCQLARLKGLDIGDAVDTATHFPLIRHGQSDQLVRAGHLIEPPDSPRKSCCDMPDDLPF